MLLLKLDLQAAATAEGVDMSLVTDLAQLGSSGKFHNNVSRDIWKTLGRDSALRSEQIHTPLASPILGEFHHYLDMILPHEMFATIYHCYRDYFFKYIMPGMDVLKKFWDQVKGYMCV